MINIVPHVHRITDDVRFLFLERELYFSQRYLAMHASEQVSVVRGGRRHGQGGGGKNAWVLEVPPREQRDGRENPRHTQRCGAIRETVLFGSVRKEH